MNLAEIATGVAASIGISLKKKSMSNEDDDFMMESGDEEDYDFQYEDDEEGEQEPYADIENKYYNAKGIDSIMTSFKELLNLGY